MVLKSVYLKNFRSHKEIRLNFSDNLNYIVGGNGQGKTSVLESIYYLCTTKGLNSKTDSEVVRFNEKEFEVNGFFRDLTDDNIRIYFSSEENRKYCFRNNKSINRHAELIGKFPVVVLTPADHSITQGYPADRRKFVDSVISQASETYLKFILDYNKVLRQRSSLLFRIKERTAGLEELDAWTEGLVKTGTEIIKHRKKFIVDFNNYILESYRMIMEGDETPTVEYSFLDDCFEEDIQSKFYEIIEAKREEEIRRVQNLVGPHKDDFIFRINGFNLKTYGSQGQNKTFQVVLRFAEFFYLKEITGKNPIFLLDDVFGELDAYRSSRISGYLKEVGQAFITLTDFADFSFLKKEDTDSVLKLNGGGITYA
jgi:DNA replication and repair protein RecF